MIPGPPVPNPMPTASSYVWDTRDELVIWVENPVAVGSLALEGDGAGAFIRIAGRRASGGRSARMDASERRDQAT